MSLHDEFEALKHLPHELAAFVKSLIHRVDPTDAPSEPEHAATNSDPGTPLLQIVESAFPSASVVSSVPDAPAPEGAEHA